MTRSKPETVTDHQLGDRELASYAFTGTGNWHDDHERWNVESGTVTANNQIPGSAGGPDDANVIVAGTVSVVTTETVNQLTVAEEAYVKITAGNSMTADIIYNDNPIPNGNGGKGRGAVTIAEWDFEDEDKRIDEADYAADAGLLEDVALLTNNNDRRLLYREFPNEPGNFGAVWDGPRDPDYFEINTISTSGYSNLSLSYRQIIDPDQDGNRASKYEVRGSIDGGNNWVVLKEEYDLDWNLLVVEDLDLPEAFANQSTILIRWVDTDGGADRSWHFIDDIVLKGAEIETGIILLSPNDHGPAGSLIHNNEGVHATVERYIETWEEDPKKSFFFPKTDVPFSFFFKDEEAGEESGPGWHFLSSPVIGQEIVPEFFPDGAADPSYDLVDLYYWLEGNHPDQGDYDGAGWWMNFKGNNWVDGGVHATELEMGRGYLISYQEPTTKDELSYGDRVHSFAGELRVGNVTWTGLSNTAASDFSGWHLLGNPFSSALEWDGGAGWSTENINGGPQIWNEKTMDYRPITGSDVESGDPENPDVDFIPAMNGFMIQVVAGQTGSITIPAAKRVHSDDFWYKNRQTGGRIHLVANNLQNGTAKDAMVIFRQNAEPGLDNLDYRYLTGYGPYFYFPIDGTWCSVNALPEYYDGMSIPMGFIKRGSGTQYNIELVDIAQSLIDNNYEIHLEDLKLGIVKNLNKAPVYEFESQNGDNPLRFVLHFNELPPDDDDPTDISEVDGSTTGLGNAWSHRESLYVYSTEDGMQVNVFDISGRQLRNYTATMGQQEFNPMLPAGIYMVRLTGQTQTKTVKVVIQ